MSTVTLRIRDDLKKKAQAIAREQHVSLNNYVNATLSAAVAQAETLSVFRDRLRDVDLDALLSRTRAFMRETRVGHDPTPEALDGLLGPRP